MKATGQYFPVVLFVTLYEVILTFESVDEILKCDHSSESYWAVFSCGAACYAAHNGSKLNEISNARIFKQIIKASLRGTVLLQNFNF